MEHSARGPPSVGRLPESVDPGDGRSPSDPFSGPSLARGPGFSMAPRPFNLKQLAGTSPRTLGTSCASLESLSPALLLRRNGLPQTPWPPLEAAPATAASSQVAWAGPTQPAPAASGLSCGTPAPSRSLLRSVGQGHVSPSWLEAAAIQGTMSLCVCPSQIHCDFWYFMLLHKHITVNVVFPSFLSAIT